MVGEIIELGPSRVCLWGHSSGAAFALEAAKRLEQHGVDVARMFLGAQLLGEAGERRAAISQLTGCGNAGLAAALSADGGYTELGELDEQRAEHLGAAYRHDCVSAQGYVADTLDSPPTVRLSAPVTVVVARDDPRTAEFSQRYRDWQLLAEHVELHELADGGHYFLRTCPSEAAKAVLGAVESWASS